MKPTFSLSRKEEVSVAVGCLLAVRSVVAPPNISPWGGAFCVLEAGRDITLTRHSNILFKEYISWKRVVFIFCRNNMKCKFIPVLLERINRWNGMFTDSHQSCCRYFSDFDAVSYWKSWALFWGRDEVLSRCFRLIFCPRQVSGLHIYGILFSSHRALLRDASDALGRACTAIITTVIRLDSRMTELNCSKCFNIKTVH